MAVDTKLTKTPYKKEEFNLGEPGGHARKRELIWQLIGWFLTKREFTLIEQLKRFSCNQKFLDRGRRESSNQKLKRDYSIKQLLETNLAK